MRRTVLFTFLLMACTRTPRETTPVTIATATYAPSLQVDLAASTSLPSGLYYRDLEVGSGPPAEAGQTVGVYYAGSLIDGRPFDATRGSPYTFRLGVGKVIPGWDQGVAGMKVGGKRQLIIPPELGYGAQGIGPIPPNAILVFTVELVGIQ